ncbi:MAG: hypothetical protein ABI867_45215 [Kofleriaceae bacterium]
MKNLIVLIALAVVGCGPSGHEIGKAKTTRYHGDKMVLFAAVRSVTEGKHKLAASDETTLTIVTKGRWFTPEGTVSNWDPGDVTASGVGTPSITGKERIEDRSWHVTLVVKLLPDGDNWIVHVEPRYLQFRSGRPNLDKIGPNDPSVPGWATGKSDQLAFEIYDAMKQYEVKSVGGVAPAPPAPAVAPIPAADPSGSGEPPVAPAPAP